MKNVACEDITFVIQGPIIKGVTDITVSNIKSLYPGSQTILSTWQTSAPHTLNVDMILYNQDPGETVLGYNKKNQPLRVNINRQILSSIEGLRHVKTQYAVKIRSDNYLTKNTMLSLFLSYSERRHEFSYFNSRVLISNHYAKEMERGLRCPYFFSDFFQFGETEDLIKLWQTPLVEDYKKNNSLKGRRQHANYPNDALHVEQIIWSNLIKQYIPVKLEDEHGTLLDIKKSYAFFVNNLILCNADEIGLEVPKRLEQEDTFPFEFYHSSRWKWLYEKTFSVDLGVSYQFKLSWWLGVVWKYVKNGIRVSLKKWWIKLTLFRFRTS